MTYTTRIAEAKSEAFEDGFSAGEEHGFSLGRNEGISLGITQGAYQKAIETAKKFLSMGLSVEQVADGTGLSVEEIEKL